MSALIPANVTILPFASNHEHRLDDLVASLSKLHIFRTNPSRVRMPPLPSPGSQTFDFAETIMFFIPYGDNIERRNLPVLPLLLIIINVGAFLYQIRCLMEPGMNYDLQRHFVEQHYTTWGLVPTALADGQVMGILSHMFIHGGWMHLIGNMLVLWTFACSLETGLGSLTLLACYIMWGIIAGLCHCGMEWGSDAPLVGASGAIAGLLGAYSVAYGPLAKIKGAIVVCLFVMIRFFKVTIPAAVFGIGWICLQMLNASMDPDGAGGVAWYAHIGGFLAGAATMLVIGKNTEQRLVRDSKGDLSFASSEEVDFAVAARARSKAREVAEQLGGGLSADMPSVCPHCKTTITNEHQIAENLSKCPQCQSLVYPERIDLPHQATR